MRTSRTMGTLLIVLGLIFIIAGGATYVMVSQELKNANVVVA